VRLASRTDHAKLMKTFAGFLIFTGAYMALGLFFR
jgi:hypothetical protein